MLRTHQNQHRDANNTGSKTTSIFMVEDQTPLDQCQWFMAVLAEGSEVQENYIFTDLAALFDQATEYGIDWTVLAYEPGEESAVNVTAQVAQALADQHYERNADAYCFEGAKTESPCALINLHAETYLEELIDNGCREDRLSAREQRWLQSDYRQAAL
ncbi:hypothetical protein MXMO3_01774 [Maritalea myrionectae]|uniref:Uncharacterized protein n=1 Tax=Maritalea myrionectae TaxID=454601 RepID=A0A2R4MEL5_9HYPH|nr:hypothetical protein [Maritalea myrionectae]AVX04299.1 hypothetical protein MXMO3_01774 [Maritalea myrionectae]